MSEHQSTRPEPDFTNYLIRSQALSVNEMAVRDLFVKEYMHDYNAVAAALRCGYNSILAVEYSQKFMQDAYVVWKIRECEERIAVTQVDSPETAEALERQRIIEGLKREANYKGPGASAAARVAAHKALMDLFGFNAPKNSNVSHNVTQGVMICPGTASVEDWEAAAADSQRKLAEDTNDD